MFNVSERRATERTPPERERSPARQRAIATQADSCVALYIQYGPYKQFLIGLILGVAIIFPCLSQCFDCNIDYINCCNILIKFVYVHNEAH